jgi:polyhydroxyalkanoate synthase
VTFLLTSGGHNAGIVSEPGHPHRHYRVATRTADDRYVDPEVWLRTTPSRDGSWWPGWVAWLDAHAGPRGAPPKMGKVPGDYAPLCDAPGTYVLER